MSLTPNLKKLWNKLTNSMKSKFALFTLYAQREADITRNVIIDKTSKIVMLTRLFNEMEFNEMKNKIEELLK